MSEIGRVVVLSEREAEVLEHVVAVFERLLRLGALDEAQQRLLVPDGVVTTSERPDVEMAEVAGEAGDILRRQLR